MSTEIIQCPECGADNLIYKKACENCGARFSQKSCPICGDSNVAEASICRKCGGTLAELMLPKWSV